MTINPAHLFDITVGNIINRMLFSERFTEETEEKFFAMKEIIDRSIEEASILDFFLDEWNIKIPPFKWRNEKIVGEALKILDIVRQPIIKR